MILNTKLSRKYYNPLYLCFQTLVILSKITAGIIKAIPIISRTADTKQEE